MSLSFYVFILKYLHRNGVPFIWQSMLAKYKNVKEVTRYEKNIVLRRREKNNTIKQNI